MNNLQGELFIYQHMNMEPNFSELARIYGLDRHTISNYWKQGGIKKVKERKKRS